MHLSMVSIGPVTPWSIRDMQPEEPNSFLFGQLIGFSLPAFQQRYTCEKGCLHILHAFRARSRTLCSSDSCSVTLDSVADETCSLSTAQSRCRDHVNAQIIWHSRQMTSNSACMGLEGGAGTGRVSVFF